MIIQDTPRQAIDWLKVAEKLRVRPRCIFFCLYTHVYYTSVQTNRTPLDCMRHAFPRRTYNWGVRSDARMREAIQEFGSDNWHLGTQHLSLTVGHGLSCRQLLDMFQMMFPQFNASSDGSGRLIQQSEHKAGLWAKIDGSCWLARF